MMLGPELTAAEAAIYESLVVPRYMSAFAAPCVDMMIQAGPAKIAQLGCRTGYPTDLLASHFPAVELAGVDSSDAAVLNGEVLDEGGLSGVTERGFLVSTRPEVQYGAWGVLQVYGGTGSGTFSKEVKNLKSGEKYFARPTR